MEHINVTAGIIKFNDLILCMQRDQAKYDYISYKFEFPGGKVEPGETNSEALKRELFEEMNIEVDVKEEDYFMTVNHLYPDFEITIHSFLCRIDSQKFQLKEHISHKWLLASELVFLDWADADKTIVKKIVEEEHENELLR